jgi:hypothetical protein
MAAGFGTGCWAETPGVAPAADPPAVAGDGPLADTPNTVFWTGGAPGCPPAWCGGGEEVDPARGDGNPVPLGPEAAGALGA